MYVCACVVCMCVYKCVCDQKMLIQKHPKNSHIIKRISMYVCLLPEYSRVGQLLYTITRDNHLYNRSS